MAQAKTKLSDAQWSEAFKMAFRDLAGRVRIWAETEPGWTMHEGSDKSDVNANPDGSTAFEINVPPFRAPKNHDDWDTPPSHAGGTLVLEPRGKNGSGQGVALLYAWPTLYQVRLVHDAQTNKWHVLTDSGIPWRHEWNAHNFVLLVHDLLAAGK